MRLKSKTAIITGAGSGIGQATAKKFLEEGAMVLATDINEETLKQLGQECDLPFVVADISKPEDAKRVADTAREQWGDLDILVNSAGITARNVDPDAPIEDRWDKVMAVNVRGSMLMCQAVVNDMEKAGGGAIVNLSSVMGSSGYPNRLSFSDGFNPYPSSKGAINQLTRDMGVRFASRGIRVNAVAPGFIHTTLTANVTQDSEIQETLNDLHPTGRMGNAEEVANVIAFLASDEASFVNGAVWMVDGGYSAQ